MGNGRPWFIPGALILVGVTVAWFMGAAPFFGPPFWLGFAMVAVGEIAEGLGRIERDVKAMRGRVEATPAASPPEVERAAAPAPAAAAS